MCQLLVQERKYRIQEVMTGINLDFFGPGEYPFKTKLVDTTWQKVLVIT